MSNHDDLKLKSGDIETAYLAVLTAIIEAVIESGAVTSESLATKISSYALQVADGDKNANAARLAGYFANQARLTKPKAK